MQGETPHERERLNAEIEKAYVNCNYAVANILTWKRFERGGSIVDIYEIFYRCFCDLVIMTEDLKQMDDKDAEKKSANAWITANEKISTSDKAILKTCEDGIVAFKTYKKALIDQLVITLPGR